MATEIKPTTDKSAQTSRSDGKYAIVKDGSKQYQVVVGGKLLIERKEAKPGDEIEFKEILLYGDGKNIQVGQPTLNGIEVKAIVEGEIKNKKVTGIKFRKREGYRRKRGHRQKYTKVKITSITTN